jgi:hypothetical protein
MGFVNGVWGLACGVGLMSTLLLGVGLLIMSSLEFDSFVRYGIVLGFLDCFGLIEMWR